MRKRFERLLDIDAKHNEIHRRCFETPYLIKFVSTAPTADTVDAGEMVYCTADNKLYIKDENGTVRSSAAFS